MIRAALLLATALAAMPASAQQADGGAPTPTPPAAAAPQASSQDLEQLKRDVLEQARKEADQRVAQAKDEMRSEVRAELATQSANRSWEEEWQEQKKKLDLLELDGYLRVRPTLVHDLDLGEGGTLFPRPPVDPGVNPLTNTYPARTQAWADMRFRVEPTINVSEDIRLRSQIDILDDLVLGSSPELDGRYPTPFFSMNQIAPANAIAIKRAWAEVNTPVGLLSFGRMGSNWGLGMFTNDGNCLDCDYGDTVDRLSFAARIAGFYIVPMFDLTGEGLLTKAPADKNSPQGQPIDLDQSDDVAGPLSGPVFTLAVAKRDTDRELQRKLDAGEISVNYGIYFSYRRQRYNSNFYDPTTGGTTVSNSPIYMGAAMYTPDVWFRLQSPRLRIELEAAGVFGSLDSRTTPETSGTPVTQSLSMTQVGAVAQGEYKALENMHLHISLEVGFASGDSAPGFGNTNTLGNTPTATGAVDGPQFNCVDVVCKDSSIDNFRFNRDYRIDLILWREILGSVTDAFYVKPGVRYDIAEGFDVHLFAVYSRSIFSASTPGGDNNLGVELDPGVNYRSDDGFVASLNYGLLIPMAGLRSAAGIDPSIAHAVRMMLAVKF